MASSDLSSPPAQDSTSAIIASSIPSSLKFLVSNIKNLVPTQLSTDNYPLWRSQIVKIFRANGFSSFLESPSSSPSEHILSSDGIQTPNPTYQSWILQDQNLAAALCSTITATVLPYILHLESTHAIWTSLELRFQCTNRSKVIQLKNELHHISMNSSTMTQYLTKIKSLVDQMASAGSTLDTEDVILYILNGLPAPY
ncbi:hypothetical protein KFK09_006821 [Dendrobium nobile]|uniref:Retrovirus-related Pol polyprotein from transposon TNT 1-94 n=1 Tax=Dendrobium nobile TaxID=94219 RepID=A0A8T3BQ68_DENNO|nr:hypothetical protein KFK09_006821 [Dendrobium nobile]